MNENAKISPAFEQFLADSGPRDRKQAIVILRPATANPPRLRGRLRQLKKRLDLISQEAAKQEPVRRKLIQSYLKTLGPASVGARPAAQPIGSKTLQLPVMTAEVTRSSLFDLARRKEVVAIIPNQRIGLIRPQRLDYATLARGEIKRKLTWGLNRLGVPEIWKQSKGADISVAVLDTGVHADHAALKGRVKDFVIIDPLGTRIQAIPSFDAGRHGTHVCGTIAGGQSPEGVSIGVAPEANLLVAGVLVGDATVLTLLVGIAWAIEKGADVINMSLGFTYYEPHFARVLSDLTDRYGVLPVVAIGNENHGNTSSPGNAFSAFSVGAAEHGPRGKLGVAFFSSGASLTFPGEEPAALVTKPDVIAPGAQVYSCIPPEQRPDGIYEYTYMDGTSMATPHVAGAVALLMAAKPAAPVGEIVEALKQTAGHPDGEAKRPDNRWGWGMIRPVEALKALS